MSKTSERALAEQIASAHGGIEHWRRNRSVEVRFSAWGLAFISKRQRSALKDVTGRFGTGEQHVQLEGHGTRGWNYEARNSVELVSDVMRLRQRLSWSERDAGTFAAMAMWNYLNLPFILTDPGLQLEVLPSHEQSLRRLCVEFPSSIATHCKRQVLHVDNAGLIRRHDYTAEAIGPFALAGQRLSGYRRMGGIEVATHRRVTPRVAGRALLGPTLVRVEIHDLQFTSERDI